MTARGSTRGGPVASPALVRASGGRQHSSNFPSFDRGSAGLPFERSQVSQALIHIFAVLLRIAFVSVTGVGIAAALFFLFFVRF